MVPTEARIAALGQPFAVPNRRLSRPAIAVMDQPIRVRAVADRQLQRIKHELCFDRYADASARDHPRARIDDERDEHKALPRGNVSEVCHP